MSSDSATNIQPVPRLIEERWVGVSFDVTHETAHQADPQGRPLFDAHGQPKTIPVTTLVISFANSDVQRVVRIPFDPDAKTELIRKLTGGVVVAKPDLQT